MPKRRANGEGNIRKRKDGRWEGRYTVGHDPETGKAIIKNVLGKTQAEVKEKLKKAIGELLGLKWTDVDLDRGVLKIQRAISRQNGKVVEAPLKTKNAYRTLPLSADAIDVLMQQRRKTGNSEWVFPSPTGGPMSPDSVLHMLQRVLKRAGLPRIRFHDLRHTFATMALQNGVDVKTVSSMLGHYSAGFTLDTYAHVTTDAQLKAAQTMGSILSRAV